MQANPVLAELTRGNWVENRYRGAICVADASGNVRASVGDIDRPIFPRSSIKAMQALAMFSSGAVEKFNLDNEALALACASHNGEPEHVAAVLRFLEKIGCTIDDLECGSQPPVDGKTRRSLVAAGKKPTAIYNNCSGKHAGMLAVAKALGVPTKGYSTREHPVQKLVRKGVEEVLGEDLSTDCCGTDGCSIPTWAAPLRQFATGFAKMATGGGLSKDTGNTAGKIFSAVIANPFLIRGTNTLDSDLMAAFGDRLMVKIGADGVFCGALPDAGLGFALKIDDGNMKAADVIVAELLLAIGKPDEKAREAAAQYATNNVKNWRRMDVGQIVATDAVRLAV